MGYEYFFSYARSDCDADLTRFSGELLARVGALRGIALADVGFGDTGSVEPGDEWPSKVSRALQDAKLFLYVRSPYYFTRPFCGLEWRAFEMRIDADRTHRESGLRLMVPVNWIPTDGAANVIPAYANDLQYTHESFGPEYLRRGLSALMKSNDQGPYRLFIEAFAQHLVKLVKAPYALPPVDPAPDVRSLTSAFDTASKAASADKTLPAPLRPATGRIPRRAFFAVAAGLHADASAADATASAWGSFVDAYDDADPDFWKPYFAPHTYELGVVLSKWLSEEGYLPHAIHVPELVGELRAVQRSRDLFLLFVDPWSVGLPAYKTWLEQYDALANLNSGVVVVVGPCRLPAPQILDGLDEVLANRRGGVDRDAFVMAAAPEELEAVVRRILATLRARVSRSRAGGPDKLAGSAPPTLSGPSR